jgi:hypothetical protein
MEVSSTEHPFSGSDGTVCCMYTLSTARLYSAAPQPPSYTSRHTVETEGGPIAGENLSWDVNQFHQNTRMTNNVFETYVFAAFTTVPFPTCLPGRCVRSGVIEGDEMRIPGLGARHRWGAKMWLQVAKSLRPSLGKVTSWQQPETLC